MDRGCGSAPANRRPSHEYGHLDPEARLHAVERHAAKLQRRADALQRRYSTALQMLEEKSATIDALQGQLLLQSLSAGALRRYNSLPASVDWEAASLHEGNELQPSSHSELAYLQQQQQQQRQQQQQQQRRRQQHRPSTQHLERFVRMRSMSRGAQGDTVQQQQPLPLPTQLQQHQQDIMPRQVSGAAAMPHALVSTAPAAAPTSTAPVALFEHVGLPVHRPGLMPTASAALALPPSPFAGAPIGSAAAAMPAAGSANSGSRGGTVSVSGSGCCGSYMARRGRAARPEGHISGAISGGSSVLADAAAATPPDPSRAAAGASVGAAAAALAAAAAAACPADFDDDGTDPFLMLEKGLSGELDEMAATLLGDADDAGAPLGLGQSGGGAPSG